MNFTTFRRISQSENQVIISLKGPKHFNIPQNMNGT